MHNVNIIYTKNINYLVKSLQVNKQLNQDKKLGVQYMVLKLMKNAVKVRSKLTDLELRSFVSVLWKKNEESENYEFAAILNDIAENFDAVNDVTSKPTKRTTRTIKVDKNNG